MLPSFDTNAEHAHEVLHRLRDGEALALHFLGNEAVASDSLF